LQPETPHVGPQRLGESGVAQHRSLHRDYLLSGTRAEGDPASASRRLQRSERTGVVRLGITVSQVARPCGPANLWQVEDAA